MTVNITLSSTFTPATPYADSLLGGGLGLDWGTGVNGQYTPIILKASNTGSLPVYISHDGAQKITEVRTHIQTYGTSTGFSYGGGDTAANDFTTIHSTLGSASGSSKNNADGNSAGLWIECDADVSAVNFFDRAARPTEVLVFGASGAGIDLSTAFTIPAAAMIYDAGGGTETAASAPVAGELGASGDTTLGDRILLRSRFYFPDSYSVGSFLQWEWVFTYAFTS